MSSLSKRYPFFQPRRNEGLLFGRGGLGRIVLLGGICL
jgi:hypothetical protein